MVDGIADLDANYLDLHSPIIDIVVSNSFFLSTGTRLISDVAANPTDVAPQKTVGSIGSIWGLTMIGNSLNHIELVGSFDATDARSEIGHSNVSTSGLGFSASHRRGSQMTTVRRSISTGTGARRQRFEFNFSDCCPKSHFFNIRLCTSVSLSGQRTRLKARGRAQRWTSCLITR